MSEKVTPKKQSRKVKYKGYAPVKFDLTLQWFVRTLLQVFVLWVLYSMFIEDVRADFGTGNFILDFFVEVPFVIVWMLISDIVAIIIAWLVTAIFNYYNEYMMRQKDRHQFSRRTWQYVFYTIIRSIFYTIGLVWLLSALLYPITGIGPINFSFFLAWIIVSFISKIIAWSIALYISL